MSAPRDLFLIASPPFAPALWDKVAERLRDRGLQVHTPPLLDAERHLSSTRSTADALAQAMNAIGRPVVLISHGAAIPVALNAAAIAPPAALVLSNGPLQRPDPLLRAFARIPQPLLTHILLQPALWLRYLTSSAGLRRAVVNPYVMDHDMVVAVCGPLVQTPQQRAVLATFLKDLAAPRAPPPPYTGPTLLPWGDDDALYPTSLIDQFRQVLPNVRHINIPGGRHLHPIERPWAIADAIHDWLRQGCTTTRMS